MCCGRVTLCNFYTKRILYRIVILYIVHVLVLLVGFKLSVHSNVINL